MLHAHLIHKTSYQYERPVVLGAQKVRLRPAPHCRTGIVSYSLDIAPKENWTNWHQDPFGNFIAHIVFPEKVSEFVVTTSLVADMAVINPFEFFVEDTASDWPFAYSPELRHELSAYLGTTKHSSLFKKYARGLHRRDLKTLDFIVDLNKQIKRDIEYVVRMEPGVQTHDETLKKRSGSCRDSAWLLGKFCVLTVWLLDLSLAISFSSRQT